jgi:ankyrin repeat protein
MSSAQKRERRDEEDEQEQVRLDNCLLNGCLKGSLDDVKVALGDGASINAISEDGRTGLLLAYSREDWEVALPMVTLLLAKRFLASACYNRGRNALYVAACCSSAEIVSILLRKNTALINFVTNIRESALLLCCRRYDLEAVKIACVLLDAGADVNIVGGKKDLCPLLAACRKGRPEVVSLLLERGANVKAMGENEYNALKYTCCNGTFGREMIPLLINARVDLLQKDKNGADALVCALGTSGEMAITLGAFLPVNHKLDMRSFGDEDWACDSDLIGSLIAGAKFGMVMREVDFPYSVDAIDA